MNHIYRLVWNKKRHMLMAVAEVASTNGKETGSDAGVRRDVARADQGFSGARTLLAAAVAALFPILALAQNGGPYDTRHIAELTRLTLNDGDDSNAQAAGWHIDNNGELDISATDTGTSLQSLSGSGTVLLGERLLTLTNASPDHVFLGSIQGSGGLLLAGGIGMLGGLNEYEGATTINQGASLALSGSGSIALSSGVLNNGQFDISAADKDVGIRSLSGSNSGSVVLGGRTLVLSAASGQYAGAITGAGGLTVEGGNEVLSGVNRYTGATTVAEGARLALTGSGSIADSRGAAIDGTLDLTMADGDTALGALSGSGAVLLGGGALELTGHGSNFGGRIVGDGGLSVSQGTHILGAATEYTGATSIGPDGTLALSGSGAIAMSSGLFNNGVFDISASHDGAQVKNMVGNGAVWLGGKTLTLTNAGGQFDGSIHGSGGLAIAGGYATLTAAQHYTGDTTIAQQAVLSLTEQASLAASREVAVDGTLYFAQPGLDTRLQSLSGSGTVILNDDSLVLTSAHSRFDGAIQGAAGLAVANGTQTLNGENGYNGVTRIDDGAGLALGSSGSIAFSSDVVADGRFDVSQASNGAQITTLSGSGAVLLGGQVLTLTQASGNFSGSIQGSGGLAIAAGHEILSGANTYSGDTVLAQGARLTLEGEGSIANSRLVLDGNRFDIAATDGGAAVKSLSGSGSVILGDQTLTITGAGDTFTGNIRGSGGLAITGGAQVLDTHLSVFRGATTIASGATLGLAGQGSGGLAMSSGVLVNGTLDIAAMETGAEIRTLSGAGAVNLGSKTLTLTNASGHFSGTIAGSGGLELAAGREILSGKNTYSGDTSIARGATLALAGNGSIANSRVTGDGTLDIAASNGGAAIKSLGGSGAVLLGSQTLTLTGAGDTFSGRIDGAGGLTVAGGSAVLAGDNRYTGATRIGAGASLALSGGSNLASSSGVHADGTFDVSRADSAQIKTLSGAGAVRLGNNTLRLSNASGTFTGVIGGNGGLEVAAGTETLGGANTYRGATTIGRQATLALSGNGSIADSRVDVAGAFDVSRSNGKAAVKSLAGAGTVRLGTQTLTLTEAADSFGGNITGAGGVKLAGGKLGFTSAQDYTGATDIAKGATLALTGRGGIAGSAVGVEGVFDVSGATGKVAIAGLGGAGSVLLGANDLSVTRASGSFSGILAGNGGLNLDGGKLALVGNNTYTGKTVVANATLRTLADANLGLGRSALELRDGAWQTGADMTHTRGLLLAGRGTVDVDAATTLVETGKVDGSGKLVKDGAGTLILRGTLANGGGLQVSGGTLALGADNSYTGGTTIGSGATLRIDRDANLGAAGSGLLLDGGRLQTTGTLDSARGIEVTAKNGVIDTEGADSVVTLDGNISGAGRIVKDGEGTLVLAGDNAGGRLAANRPGDGWTGGLTINSGLVKVTNSWGLGWGSVMTFNSGTIHATVDILTGQDINMGRKTDINVDAGTTTTLAGDLISTGAGDGCFNKTGLGTLNVTGAARIDATCVLEGKLLANGVFASKVMVAKGATLGGAGTLQGDVTVHGTLSPGNSPGMLSADSNITMAAGSTYKQDIGGARQAGMNTPIGAAGHYSFLHVVNGKRFTIESGATLAPALKNLYTPGQAGYGSAQFVPELGQNFLILTADGGIDGRFDTLAQPEGLGANTRLAAFYDHGGNNSIELKVLPASYATWAGDASANARSVGAALDRIVDLDQAGKGSAAQTSLSYQTGSRNAQQLGGVLQGLAGEVHGALAAALPQANWELQRTLLQRSDSQDGRALWIDLGAGRAKWKGGDVASDFDADRVQVTVGFDLLKERDVRLGFGASHASTDLDALAGNGKLRQNKVFAYGEAAAGKVVFDLQGSYGRDKTESRRADPLDPAAGLATRGSGNSALLGVGASLPTLLGGASFAPFARVTLQRVERDALAESPASVAALALDEWSANGARAVLGLSGASRNLDPLLASTWRFKLGAGVDGGELLRPVLGATLAGERIAVGAPDVGRGFVQGGVTGTVQLRKGAYLYFGVSGEARSDYHTVGGNAGLRGVF
ncbi:autotransporter-associated beta strand repeat-containing protein [Massilia oculi]|uniref:autotransporter-associated beta strand repeat-containing protein n=1 Tax=Massilia oculi TaxID=945844 RepID=UPI001AAFF84A|nr:autotransporter-associated beta strand repeat-containing protein [Massilia oculi]